MKRIYHKYGKLKKQTMSVALIGNVDYRFIGIDGYTILAFDHEHEIVIDTRFFETDDFFPINIGGKSYPSDYHQMVLDRIKEEVLKDRTDIDAQEPYEERNHQ